MRIGFLNNQIDARGTGNAMFHYAHYNETILGNTSKIYTFQEIKADFEMKLEDFELFWYSKPIKTLREFGLLVL